MEKTKRVMRTLNLKETLALNRIVVARYKDSCLNNVEFAVDINVTPEERKLFRFDLNAGHIGTAIEGAEIEPNMRRQSTPAPDNWSLTLRVQALEDQLNRLTQLLITKGIK